MESMPPEWTCQICKTAGQLGPSDAWDMACSDCKKRVPSDLIKAINDPYLYALGLRTGEAILFHTAHFNGGEFVHLSADKHSGPYVPSADHSIFGSKTFPVSPERGIDVRISDIVWCLDAHHTNLELHGPVYGVTHR